VNSLSTYFAQTDAIGQAVALVLFAMSVASWVIILWKSAVLRRARRDIARHVPAFWQAHDLATALQALRAADREHLLTALVQAVLAEPTVGSLGAATRAEGQLTQRLREALQQGLSHLQSGQVMLASVGSTAPFVGLFGTVWGIYHALTAIGDGGGFSIERVSGPVGEALVMTAAGLAVAIPAVLAYNLFGRWIGLCESALEGFAHDLREWALSSPDKP
jgi:biopolymer transport protein ExbB